MGRTLSDQRVVSMWAVCETDQLTIEIKPHRDHEQKSLPPEEDWDSSHLTCPVCGDWLDPDEVVYAEESSAPSENEEPSEQDAARARIEQDRFALAASQRLPASATVTSDWDDEKARNLATVMGDGLGAAIRNTEYLASRGYADQDVTLARLRHAQRIKEQGR